MRAVATAIALASALWIGAVHALLGIGAPKLAFSIALAAVAAFGVGYELGDAGVAAALFLLLALGGAFLTAMLALDGVPSPGMPLAFATGPGLIMASSAHVGGSLREARA